MRRLAFALSLLVGWISAAGATSTINPMQPAAGTAYSSTPSRNNFQAAYNDINALQNCNKGASPPSAPNGGYCWINSAVSTAWIYSLYDSTLSTWTPIGQLNTVTGVWTPLGGNSPIQSAVANNAALSARASTAFPNGVTRLGFASAGDGPIITYFASSAACSLNSGAGDGGSQIQTADGKCWIGVLDPSHLDVRIWGAQTTLADNGPMIQAAINYTQANGGEVHVPGNAANLPYTMTTVQAGFDPWGTCLQAFTGTKIIGDRLGGVGSGGAGTTNSRLYCAADADIVSTPSSARVNNLVLRDIELDGHAAIAALSNTSPTVGIQGGFGTGEQVENVVVKDVATCYVPANGDESFIEPLCSQQAGYPGNNGYPSYGLEAPPGKGQLQGFTQWGGSFLAMQLAHTYLFNGDASTKSFIVDLTSEQELLWRADGFKVSVSGVPLALGVDYGISDATPGAPSSTIYGTTVSTTFKQNSYTLTVSSATGLPSSITCTGTGVYGGCAPLILMQGWAIPVGSYLTAVSGTTLTFANADGVKTRSGATESVVFAEANVGGTVSGCNLNRALVGTSSIATASLCGRVISVNFVSAPAMGTGNVEALWSDPWGLAAVSLKAGNPNGGASDDIIRGLNVGSYAVGYEDVSNGNNVFEAAYVQITNVCTDLWTFGTSVRFPQSSSATVPGCQSSYFGTTAGTNTFTFNAQGGNDGHEFTASSPHNLLLCSNLGTCPLTIWASPTYQTIGIAATPVQVFDGWWGVAGAGSAEQTQVRSGTFLGSNLAMQVQRPVSNADVSPHCIGQTVRTIRSRTLAGSYASLSQWIGAGANFSSVDGSARIRVFAGTGTDEGTASAVAGTWAGQQTLLDISPVLRATTSRYTASFFVPNTTNEIAIEDCWTPTGTAGADDTMSVDGSQLEPGYLASAFQFHLPEDESDWARAEIETSYQIHTVPGTVSSNGNDTITYQSATAAALERDVQFRSPKNCTSPTVTIYSPGTGTVNKASVSGGTGDETASTSGVSANGFLWIVGSWATPSIGQTASEQWGAVCPGLF